MIKGVGVDIIEIQRINKAIKKQSFLEKCYTQKEIQLYSEDVEKMAGNFAVKEAVAKALGTGFRNFSPKDIEVLRYDNGKPFVVLYNEALNLKNQIGIESLNISISHNKKDAIAFCVGSGLSEF